jgi:GntR family transcriptional regulator
MNLIRSEKNNIPLYFQLEQIIKSKLITGEYLPGEQIPTEKNLCEAYHVSSITARQAILNLVSQGLVTRRQGKGTFVTNEITNITTLQFKGNIDDLVTDGLIRQQVKVIDIIKIKPSRKVQNLLNIEGEEEVVQVRRTRNANDIPVSYLINYLPLDIGENIKKEDLSVYPMLQVLRDKLRIPLTSGTQFIEAIVADYNIASALLVSVASPILYIESTIFTNRKKPVEYVQNFIRPDRYKYSIKLGAGKLSKEQSLHF